ncbi:MAG TPA: FmdB family zinc ribbon protein [Vicinamibacterales bacterium]|nr:FmdB family zinc ribbon protein [Vicinamibacterales bacterium]
MPLYEYQCDKCAHRFEVIQKFSDAPIDVCPKCGGPVKKLLSSPAIQFKGTGWYITDYARSGKTDGASAPASSETKTDTKTDTKTETKSEPAKTESKGTP